MAKNKRQIKRRLSGRPPASLNGGEVTYLFETNFLDIWLKLCARSKIGGGDHGGRRYYKSGELISGPCNSDLRRQDSREKIRKGKSVQNGCCGVKNKGYSNYPGGLIVIRS